eukprot:gene30166-36443_t
MSAKASPWDISKRTRQTKLISFRDILKEQEETGGNPSFAFDENAKDEASIDDDQLAQAIALSLEGSGFYDTDTCHASDLALAQALQQVEDEEFNNITLSDINSPSRQPYEKVTLKKQYMVSECPPARVRDEERVHSVAWADAVALERKAMEKGLCNLPVNVCHEPLVQSLQTSEYLTELQGVGDLYGGRILVSKDLGRELNAFVRKEEKKAAKRRQTSTKSIESKEKS